MVQLKHILYLSILASKSIAFAVRANLQGPLMQPLPSQDTSSRRIVLRGSSNAITGSYPLYDLLSISTQSGAISVDVSPHSASSQDPTQPATLELISNSGRVHATLSEALADPHAVTNGVADPPPPYSSTLNADDVRTTTAVAQSGFPDRKYITIVSTQSGEISGTFPLGARTELEAHSGSLSGVELVVLPMNASGSRQLSTVSRSGWQSVRITEDYFGASNTEAWWKGMLSKHEGGSGAVTLDYPDSWEGTIDVESETGSVSVTGRDVEVIKKERGRVVARKGGQGGGKVIVRAASGKVDLRFG